MKTTFVTSQGSLSHPYQYSTPCSLRILHEDETVNRVPPAPLAAFGSHKLTATQIRRARMSKQMSEDCTRQTQKVLHYPLTYSGKDTGCMFEKLQMQKAVKLKQCTFDLM